MAAETAGPARARAAVDNRRALEAYIERLEQALGCKDPDLRTVMAYECGLADGRAEPVEAERDALRAALDRVRALHHRWGLYDDCGHEHADDEPGVACVEDIGYVCGEGLMRWACFECCCNSESQTEQCADYHEDCWPCPTIRAITQDGETP
jgi:hypothetical protein